MLADKLSYHEGALMINGRQSLLIVLCLKQLVHSLFPTSSPSAHSLPCL